MPLSSASHSRSTINKAVMIQMTRDHSLVFPANRAETDCLLVKHFHLWAYVRIYVWHCWHRYISRQQDAWSWEHSFLPIERNMGRINTCKEEANIAVQPATAGGRTWQRGGGSLNRRDDINCFKGRSSAALRYELRYEADDKNMSVSDFWGDAEGVRHCRLRHLLTQVIIFFLIGHTASAPLPWPPVKDKREDAGIRVRTRFTSLQTSADAMIFVLSPPSTKWKKLWVKAKGGDRQVQLHCPKTRGHIGLQFVDGSASSYVNIHKAAQHYSYWLISKLMCWS